MSSDSKNGSPKKLDWIVFGGFVVFMIAMIGAVFGQNFRWLGIAFLIMPVVFGFGLVNNLKNFQPDWDQTGDDGDLKINVPNAPKSLKSATGQSSNNPRSKVQYWAMIVSFMITSLFFGGLGLFLLFSEFAADNF